MKKTLLLILCLVVSVTFLSCTTTSKKIKIKSHDSIRDSIKLQDYKTAYKCLQEILEIDPEDAEAHNLMGICYDEFGEHLKAVKEFEAAYKYDPGNIEYSNRLGISYASMKETEKAKDQFQRSIEIEPDDGDAYFYLGKLKWQEGKYEEAISFWKRCLILDKNNIQAADAIDKAKDKIKQEKEKKK